MRTKIERGKPSLPIRRWDNIFRTGQDERNKKEEIGNRFPRDSSAKYFNLISTFRKVCIIRMGNSIVATFRSFFARVWRAPFIGILLVLLYAHVNANVHLRNYNQSFLKPETRKYCVPGISTSRTYRLFQPLRPSPPHILSLSWRASRDTSTRTFCLTLHIVFLPFDPLRGNNFATWPRYSFIITLSLIQFRFEFFSLVLQFHARHSTFPTFFKFFKCNFQTFRI